MSRIRITSHLVILDVEQGRRALIKRIAERAAEGAEPIKVTITGYVMGANGNDDGVSQEFEVCPETVKLA